MIIETSRITAHVHCGCGYVNTIEDGTPDYDLEVGPRDKPHAPSVFLTVSAYFDLSGDECAGCGFPFGTRGDG